MNIIIIPGIIFGKKGDNYFRVSALGKAEDINKAINRIKKYYSKEDNKNENRKHKKTKKQA